MSGLDNFYKTYLNNVVLRDNNGRPGIFVRFPKVNGSYFSAALEDEPLLAFKCGSAVDDAVLIGKYLNSHIDNGATLYPLPNAEIARDVTIEESIENNSRCMDGTTFLTAADWGLLCLYAQKYNLIMHSPASPDGGYVYKTGSSAPVGRMYWIDGRYYRCLVAHTTAVQYKPENMPSYWEAVPGKVEYTPGTGEMPFNAGNHIPLSGSGNLTYYLGHDIAGVTDFIDTAALSGIRYVGNELQVFANNENGDPGFVYSADKWRAIKPHSSDNGYDYVAPGTEGTLKLKVTGTNKMTWTTDLSGYTYSNDWKPCPLADLSVDTNTIPVIPTILYELGLLLLPETVQPAERLMGRIQIYDSSAISWTYVDSGSNGHFSFTGSQNSRYSNYYITSRLRAREAAAS